MAETLRVVGEGRDLLHRDMGTALSMRAMTAAGATPETAEKLMPVAQRSKGADRWMRIGIVEMARECLQADGIDAHVMTRNDICTMIFERGGALGTTGSFTNLTLDAANKSLMVGYTQAPSTWEGPMRRGESVPDFKTVHRIRLGAIPNLPIWPDDTDPQKVKFADAQEKYAVECRSAEFGFSYRAMMNDDMSALTRVPAMMGMSAKRTVNAFAWSIVTSNPTLGTDGVALFSAVSGARKRSNLTTGANAPSTANIQTSQNLMMQMHSENTPEGNESSDVLAIMPKYIIGPSALYQSIVVLTRSTFDPVTNQFQNFNIASQLTGVIEPLLDANSTTAWYLFCDPIQMDTIEVSFLQGQETPVVRNFVDPRNLVQNFTVLQTFGGGAMNHRGVQKQLGA